MITIRQFKTERFTIALQWEQEFDEDLSWIDADGRAKLDSGEWTNCCFRVAVFIDDHLLTATYLGNSVYEDPNEFAKEHLGINHQPGTGCYFPNMVREAITEARKLVYAQPTKPRIRRKA